MATVKAAVFYGVGKPFEIRDVECVAKTYPRFFHDLNIVTTSG